MSFRDMAKRFPDRLSMGKASLFSEDGAMRGADFIDLTTVDF